MRKNYPGADKVVYLPFASRSNAKRWLRIVPLEMAIFAKYEFWPAYLKALKRNHIPTYMISAIFRPSQLFFKPWGRWYRRLLHCFDHIFVQDEASCTLLAKYKVHTASVAGDTRFDRVTEVMHAAKELPIIEGFVEGSSRVLVAGSTWPLEEEMLARYMAEREDVRLILVPHEIHGAHMHQIFQYFEGRYIRYTQATPLTLKKCRTMVIDTMGLLSSIYRYGQVAYIGGGFGTGIHNTLEAAVYGMPVVFGPKWQKFREAQGLLRAGAATSVSNYQQFAAALDNAFAQQATMGSNADTYVKSELGATEKIYRFLFQA
jgi:3-deoxy-D-manno-octulosonic-acid transferase